MVQSKLDWSEEWPRGWGARWGAGPGRGNSLRKAWRQFGAGEDQNRGCPFGLPRRLTPWEEGGMGFTFQIKGKCWISFPWQMPSLGPRMGQRTGYASGSLASPAVEIRPSEIWISALPLTGSQLPWPPSLCFLRYKAGLSIEPTLSFLWTLRA